MVEAATAALPGACLHAVFDLNLTFKVLLLLWVPLSGKPLPRQRGKNNQYLSHPQLGQPRKQLLSPCGAVKGVKDMTMRSRVLLQRRQRKERKTSVGGVSGE